MWSLPDCKKKSKTWKRYREMDDIAQDNSAIQNGSSLGNPGFAGAGLVIGRSSGQVAIAKSIYLNIKNSLEVETLALVEGLQTAFYEGVEDLEVEVDSLILLKLIRREFKIPWRIEHYLRAIWNLTGDKAFMKLMDRDKQKHSWRAN
ncbi:hypothetical protein OROHE_013645 [Orobanche hederae]